LRGGRLGSLPEGGKTSVYLLLAVTTRHLSYQKILTIK